MKVSNRHSLCVCYKVRGLLPVPVENLGLLEASYLFACFIQNCRFQQEMQTNENLLCLCSVTQHCSGFYPKPLRVGLVLPLWSL